MYGLRGTAESYSAFLKNKQVSEEKRPNTSLRAQSRVNWGRKQENGIPTDEQLATGAMLRIADNLETKWSTPTWDVQELIRVGRNFIRYRRKHPQKDQFHFTFEQPKVKTYFSLTIFGITLSITKP